jgi:fatty acid desaturase
MSTSTAPESRVRAHRFPADIRAEIRALHKLDNWHGPLAWAEDVVWIVGAISAARLCGPAPLFWAVYLLVTVPVVATRQRALATLLHESAHGSLARNRRLNRLLGTYCSGYLIFQTYEAYFASHVKGHHGHFGDPDRDPDLRDHIRRGLYEKQSTTRFVWRHLVRPFVIAQIALAGRLIIARTVFGGSGRAELGRLVVFVAGGTVVAGTLFGYGNVGLFWYGPLLLGFPTVNWYLELLEHFPYPASAQFDIEATRHRVLGPVTRRLFGIHNEGYHLDHHLSPGIPFWNLPRAHRARMRDPEYAAAVARSAGGAGSSLWRQFRVLVQEAADLNRG